MCWLKNILNVILFFWNSLLRQKATYHLGNICSWCYIKTGWDHEVGKIIIWIPSLSANILKRLKYWLRGKEDLEKVILYGSSVIYFHEGTDVVNSFSLWCLLDSISVTKYIKYLFCELLNSIFIYIVKNLLFIVYNFF